MVIRIAPVAVLFSRPFLPPASPVHRGGRRGNSRTLGCVVHRACYYDVVRRSDNLSEAP